MSSAAPRGAGLGHGSGTGPAAPPPPAPPRAGEKGSPVLPVPTRGRCKDPCSRLPRSAGRRRKVLEGAERGRAAHRGAAVPCMGSGCPAASGSSLEAPLTCRPGTQNQPQTPRLRLVGAMPRLPKRPREGAGVMLSRAPSRDFSAHPHGAGCQAARPAPAPARGSPRLLLSCWAGCQQRHVGAGGQVPSAQAVVIPLSPSGLRRAAASPGGTGLGLVWSCGIWDIQSPGYGQGAERGCSR